MSTLPVAAPFSSVLTPLDERRGIVPPPSELACRKVIDTLDRRFDRALEDSYGNTLY
jgi:hypothetical protein